MQLDIRTISQSDVTGGKTPVVVEGFHPELIPYLENSFVIFQRCEDQEDYFTSEESVLNALKPKLYITYSLDKFDSDLCKSFGCEIEGVQAFKEKQLLRKGMQKQVEDNGYRNTLEESIADMSSLPPVLEDNPSFMLDVEEADLNNPPGLKSPDIWNIQLKSSNEGEVTSHDN